jgi:hypothetical protein
MVERKQPVEAGEIIPPAKRAEMIAGTRLIEPPAGRVGDVKRFLLACLPRAQGEEGAAEHDLCSVSQMMR